MYDFHFDICFHGRFPDMAFKLKKVCEDPQTYISVISRLLLRIEDHTIWNIGNSRLKQFNVIQLSDSSGIWVGMITMWSLPFALSANPISHGHHRLFPVEAAVARNKNHRISSILAWSLSAVRVSGISGNRSSSQST